MALNKKRIPGRFCNPLILLMAFLAITLSIVIITPAALTAPGSEIKSRDKFFAVHFIDAHHGCITGDKGLILYTDTGGETWERREQPMHYPLYDITFAGPTHGWIVGGAGTILHSSDGGKTWQTQDSQCTATLMSVSAIDEQRLVVVGEGGIILETTDGGRTWRPNSFDMFSALPEDLIERGVVSPNLYDVASVETGQGWIVGDNGIVLYCANAGADWQVRRIGFLPSLYSVYFQDDNHGWAAGQNGLMLHTIDGGLTWNQIELKTDQNIYKISLQGSAGVVVGENGVAFQSVDFGKTWQQANLSMHPPFPWFTDVSVLPAQSPERTVVCVGERSIETFTLPVAEKD